MDVQRAASVVSIALVGLGAFLLTGPATAMETCRIDPSLAVLVCSDSGTITRPGNDTPTPGDPDDPGKRYVYTTTDAVVGDCYYWSNVPGGLDAWDPANDGAVIAITASLPLCPPNITAPSDPEAIAWSIFRSWDLVPPTPTITPSTRGITGVPTHVTAAPPPGIAHSEVMPDGRTLDVRAGASLLTIDWGDGTVTVHDPTSAVGFPDGSAAHTYRLKTCTPTYRAEHPSGGLCHPTAEYYPIVASYVWTGEYSVGSGWVALGSLAVSAAPTLYDVDEARGVSVP